MLLVETLALLRQAEPRWRLVVCGEGQLRAALAERIEQLGLTSSAELRGYVPIDEDLLDMYRSSHAFLHVSWTEGAPQVLTEAFASGLPVVATAVGGVPEAAGDAALLMPPGDAAAAAAALARIATDADLRDELIRKGFERAREHTIEHETARVAAFIAGGVPTPTAGAPARRPAG
jgi:glycosyltransferase involved in cell wall biosynthesis